MGKPVEAGIGGCSAEPVGCEATPTEAVGLELAAGLGALLLLAVLFAVLVWDLFR